MNNKNPGVRYNDALTNLNAMPEALADLAFRYFVGAIRTQMLEPNNRGKLSAKRVADALTDAYVFTKEDEAAKNKPVEVPAVS